MTDVPRGKDGAKPPRGRFALPTGRGFWLRSGAVAIFDALVVFAIPQVVANASWTLLTFLLIAGLAVNWAYLNPRAQASRWLTPGLILMAIFVVYPVIYTFYVSLTNWQTGNFLVKDQVIENLEQRRITDGEVESLDLAIYRDAAGEYGFLVYGGESDPYFGTPRERTADPLEDSAIDLGGITEVDPAAPPESIGDYELVPRLALAGSASEIQDLVLDIPGGTTARVETLSTVAVSQAGQRFTYDPETDVLTDNQLGLTCPAGVGAFYCDGVPEADVSRAAQLREDSTITCSGGTCDEVPLFAIDGSLPGWRDVIGFENYTDILSNERIRAPFFRVFLWNVFFAVASVVMTFALGLGLAIALQNESMRGRAIYRSIYILPYAIPAFLSVLVWRGLLNTEFGKVNGVLEAVGLPGVNWLGDPWWVLVAVLLANLWLGFPYMFLISSGALTSVPEELLEAARTDGANAWQAFRSVTLPLLLVSTAPLLIGSFAFNFNNFVLIFLLTGGGPPLSGYDVPVGASDLLISFTFNLAQGAGRGNQFGLSSAIIVVIFVVLAISAGSSFRLTKRLEEIYER